MSRAAVARRTSERGARLPRRRTGPHDRSEPILAGAAPIASATAVAEPVALFAPAADRVGDALAAPVPALSIGSRTGATETEAVAAPPV
ncbi:hypothetical protein, partial [Phreatobacter sp. AB_2022a]|uniref:hypothetical protein n=1 Tax=Phreatobacter sp. AB_2022a TaxID=3003134 RepID=UPI002286E976